MPSAVHILFGLKLIILSCVAPKKDIGFIDMKDLRDLRGKVERGEKNTGAAIISQSELNRIK